MTVYFLALFLFIPGGKSQVQELHFQDKQACLMYAASAQARGIQTPILCVQQQGYTGIVL